MGIFCTRFRINCKIFLLEFMLFNGFLRFRDFVFNKIFKQDFMITKVCVSIWVFSMISCSLQYVFQYGFLAGFHVHYSMCFNVDF
jgi:uncharacterized membrane protein